jgi:hypothetical protein
MGAQWHAIVVLADGTRVEIDEERDEGDCVRQRRRKHRLPGAPAGRSVRSVRVVIIRMTSERGLCPSRRPPRAESISARSIDVGGRAVAMLKGAKEVACGRLAAGCWLGAERSYCDALSG